MHKKKKLCYSSRLCGEVAEWSIVPDSKSGVGQPTEGSNPSLSARTQANKRLLGRFFVIPTKTPTNQKGAWLERTFQQWRTELIDSSPILDIQVNAVNALPPGDFRSKLLEPLTILFSESYNTRPTRKICLPIFTPKPFRHMAIQRYF